MKSPLPLACLASMLGACSPYSVTSTTPPLAAFGPSAPELGTVCVVRRSLFARAVPFAIHDNGQLVGATKGDSYFCYLAEPGPHQLVSDTGDSTDHPGYARLLVLPDRRYWLHQDHENHLGVITSKLEWIDEQRARELVPDCEYKVIVEAGHEALPPPIPIAASERR